MTALALLKAYWLPALILLALLCAGYGLYHHGVGVGSSRVQAQWDKATADALVQQQTLATMRQRNAGIILENTQSELDKVSADLAAANKQRVGLLSAANKRVAAIATACTAASSQAAAENAGVLADVLQRADERAGILAGIADQAITRGLACEANYASVSK